MQHYGVSSTKTPRLSRQNNKVNIWLSSTTLTLIFHLAKRTNYDTLRP